MGTSCYGERASGHRALRRGRVSIPGRVYLVTFSTHERQDLFRSHHRAACLAKCLHGLSLWQHTQLIAWVLMPDHMHLLIRISDKEGLQTVVQKLKSNTALAIKSLDGGIAQVWARAFHDRALRKDEDIRQVARYIVLNPVRAGLVRRIGDYPYWDAVWL